MNYFVNTASFMLVQFVIYSMSKHDCNIFFIKFIILGIKNFTTRYKSNDILSSY
jgi:hypothetical protein